MKLTYTNITYDDKYECLSELGGALILHNVKPQLDSIDLDRKDENYNGKHILLE